MSKLINLPTHKDARGNLTVLNDELPFESVRSYWIYGADNQIRGGHRHKKTIQALIAMNGTVNIFINDGVSTNNVSLSNPCMCLILDPIDWHTMKFEKNSVLLVMSSQAYDRDDYIDEPYERKK
jgi:ethanolamine ammonia-lyase small subunit